ncbi:type I restriction enzyme HsdR N-terminal domain-containing protein [Parageobacillus toebii]|jgi:hypothetical protein|uniref:type I restriction enzyme HsdR N-terminal domain-containing protein n=1 Tax=Parageobacillus toebii TaxID=153151 RepID=UPI0019688035|nr:type I restriction enzyme HsdR N-terminal domain-containing protein [Parageobacillus toebii]MED4990048.1 type I restriction enzyme HsdR N-terminal domain-containing protein [Parageobacillus toebii]QSB47764.1 type I restriction enzyme HsdR N-terminal domain-containing protein [Parageobacillus toebii]
MKIYKKNGKKFLYDMVKGILRPATPEEKVRQKVVKYLVEQMKIPIEAIETELLLSSIDNLSKLRADIVVWHINEATNSEECLLIIEVKAPHVPLTEKTLEQVMSYQSILKSKYVAITNGEDLEIYQIRENGTAQLLTTELYTYEDLINSNVKFAKKRTMRRLSFDEINYHRYINMLIDKGYIGEETDPDLHPFLAELQNFILVEPISCVLPIQFKGISLEQDLGYSFHTYGNAAGGSFPGYYRGFVVKTLDGNEAIYRIGMFGTAKLINDPIFGNRKSYTVLNVATEDMLGYHNSLELNIDNSISKRKTEYRFFHNGRLTAGKKGSVKIEKVKNYVSKYAPDLLVEDKIYLGSLPNNMSISWDQGQQFIMNLLLYANIRDKLRNDIKKR